jgi:hypothetical protein
MWLKFSVADLNHYEADPDPSLSLMQILIRIRIRLGPFPLQTLLGSILSLHASNVNVRGPQYTVKKRLSIFPSP